MPKHWAHNLWELNESITDLVNGLTITESLFRINLYSNYSMACLNIALAHAPTSTLLLKDDVLQADLLPHLPQFDPAQGFC